MNDNRLIHGMQVGTLIDRDHPLFKYGKPMSQKPILGCGVLYQGQPIAVAYPKDDRI
jgi:hypothetical protein